MSSEVCEEDAEYKSECYGKVKCRVGVVAWRSSLRRRLLRAKSLGHVGQVHGRTVGPDGKSEVGLVGEASFWLSYESRR